MTSNVQGTRPSNRAGDPAVADTTPTPVITPGGVGGVAVYDRDIDATTNAPLRSSASTIDERVPMETRSSGSMVTWIIGAVVLILLVYFLLNFVF